MDRNQVIGFALIAVLFVGFMYVNQPSEEELKRQAEIRDSIARVDSLKQLEDDTNTEKETVLASSDSSGNTSTIVEEATSAKVEEELISLENELIKVQVSNIGGKLAYVQLKEYKRSDEGKTELVLTTPETTELGFEYNDNGRSKNTNGIPFKIIESDENSAVLQARVGGSLVTHRFDLQPNSYRLDFSSNWEGGQAQKLHWKNKLLLQEKAIKPERDATTVFYKEYDSKADYLSEVKDEDEEVLNENKVEWISFKQQFFNQALIPDEPFSSGEVKVTTPTKDDYLKVVEATMDLPNQSQHKFWYYLGPNHYQTLNKFDIGLEKVIPLGWGIFGWVNKFLIIPVFNFLSDIIGHEYGIIILILTFFIKIILLFFTYKAFMSGAKMRALKPELDELKKKHEGDAQTMQMEQMKLYRVTGVSPFGGCLPMILQFPILIAMFRFFPSSIELRQQKFLWADDLSSYDSIWDFGYVPIIDTIYGDHVSLFALLMTVTTFIYTVINQRYQPTQQKELKYLPYIMPLFFLSFLNRYSSALSYYYFLANLISIGQTYLFKAFVDEKKLRAKIEANKNKPQTADAGGNKSMQSRMAKFLEQQQKKQQAIQQQRSKKKKK